MTNRTNEEWLNALQGPEQAPALEDLRKFLLRGLGHALNKQSNLAATDLEDFVQDALLKILDSLDSFRGESRFTTWAQKIAVRVALTELRRRRWRDRSLDELIEAPTDEGHTPTFMPSLMADSTATPEQQALQSSLLDAVQKTIQEKLTDKQRQAMIAIRVHGMPLEEVARRMDTNRNSLYKLLHDARQKLKSELLGQGLSAEEILAVFE